MAHPTIRDILLIYNIDRVVYDKFVNGGMEPGLARNAVGIFMCLEKFGINMISQIAPIIDPTTISRLIAEAHIVLHHIRPNHYPIYYNAIPLINSLAKTHLDILLNSHKGLIVRGVAFILDGVGSVVFDDHMYELLCAYETEMAMARARLRAAMPVVPPELANLWAVMPVVPPELAMLYDFSATSAPLIEDARSTFLTFMEDCPIREGDILEYFKSWGSAECIDRLIMSGRSTTYGKMVFKSDTYISLLLNGSEQPVQYFINGKPIWVQKYVTRVVVN